MGKLISPKKKEEEIYGFGGKRALRAVPTMRTSVNIRGKFTLPDTGGEVTYEVEKQQHFEGLNKVPRTRGGRGEVSMRRKKDLLINDVGAGKKGGCEGPLDVSNPRGRADRGIVSR